MAINDVSLTSGMRSNLLSLQGTVDLLNRTQSRLSTGKKVNSAIDNPVSFFASQALNSRASVIDSLKDAMGQAVQTITAADKGIKAITAMIEQAKGIAQSAQSAAAGASSTLSTVGAHTFVAGTVEIDLSGVQDGDTITWGGTDYEYQSGGGADFQDAAGLVTLLQANGYANSSALGSVVTAAINGTTVATGAFSEVGSIAIGVGTAESAATTFNVDGVTYTTGTDFAVGGTDAITATNLAAAITGQANVVSATADGTNVTVAMSSDELDSLESQYNALRTQLSAIAADSGYKGKNLLEADTLAVKFEGATLNVTGFNASAAGLAIAAATWTTGGSIDGDITLLDAALVTLRQESSKMSGNLSIITVRQEFSTNMINTLTEGADKLTLADTNEEGANMLMLQTRQSLSTTALSLSAQAAQSVLRLFG